MQHTAVYIVFRMDLSCITFFLKENIHNVNFFCRLKSSSGVSGINRIDSSFEPDSPGLGALSRNELETVSFARDRSVLAEQRLMAKGNNK